MLTKAESQSIGLAKGTQEKVNESAKKFKSAKEWSRLEGSAYNSARRNGWIKEASLFYKK